MKANALILVLLLFCVTVPLCWYLNRDTTSCSVFRAGKGDVDGFYAGYGGVYVQRGHPVTYNPDIFDLFTLRRHIGSHSIAFRKNMWSINNHNNGQIVYVNTPENPEEYIYFPPKLEWKAAKVEDLPGPVVTHCIGSLEITAPMVSAEEQSNLGELMQRPVTTILLVIIFALAYYLWAYNIDVSAVSYSYDAVVLRGEYWRVITASFSHFDIMHLGFNTMSLYQLGMLESVYGSAVFLYLNIALVLITMLICTAIYHVMIHRYGRAEYGSQQAVGFSCVLFAWMVALSVRLKEYCPIFLFPTFCVDTWMLPLPSSVSAAIGLSGIPVNVGPFILLAFTKLIIPRSSFVGHLSGIIIGYPLAWNMLNWLTLPLVISIVLCWWLISERPYVWSYPGFAATSIDLEGVMSAMVLRFYKIQHIVAYFLVFSLPVAVYVMGIGQLLPRALLGFLAWSSAQAFRIEQLNSSPLTKENCGRIMVVALWLSTATLLYDSCSLAGSVISTELLLGCGLKMGYIRLHMQFLIFMVLVESTHTILLLGNVLEARGAAPLLSRMRCDVVAVVDDLMLLTRPCAGCCPSGAITSSGGGVVPFSGPAHRLSNQTSSHVVHV